MELTRNQWDSLVKKMSVVSNLVIHLIFIDFNNA